MKIVFLCDSIFSYGGVQKVLAVIATELSKYNDVIILTHDKAEESDATMYGLDRSAVKIIFMHRDRPAAWEYLPCKTYSFLYKKVLPHKKIFSIIYNHSSFSYTQQKRLEEHLNRIQADIVIGVHAFISIKLAIIRKRLEAKKVIGWIHTSYEALFDPQGAYLPRQKEQFRYIIPNLNSVIVLTRHDRILYKSQLNIETITIHNPVTLEETHILPKERIQKRFLAIGRLSHQTKGFDLLIEAFAQFRLKHDGWILDIIGEGPEEPLLRNLIRKHRMENSIKIHPFTQNIASYYSASDVFILSSRWEGFPLVLCEAMSMGLPVIASDLPVVKEILSDEQDCLIFQNGCVASLAEKMDRMVTLKDIHTMGKAAFAKSRHFLVSDIIEQWKKLIND